MLEKHKSQTVDLQLEIYTESSMLQLTGTTTETLKNVLEKRYS